ncbi:hypothetical protein FACS189425_02710 [Clostridia bacterium]|nr:hypothetical protein FACS189425_02710 [Clostridia bacterium]
MKRKETLWELQERYDKALAESGQRVSGRLGKIQRSTVIIRRHELLGKDRIDDEVVADYINEVVGKLNDGVIKSNHANSVLREARQFLQFVKTGEVKMANPQLGAKAVLRPEFRQIVDDFLLSDSAMLGAGGKETSPNTRNDMRWVAHKYFEWLGKQEISDMRGVGAEQIQKFMLYCSETMAMDSVHNIRLHLKKLYAYLCAAGISKSSYEALLSFRVNRGNKIPETRGANELAAMLDAIDRSSVDGKRAYAVMMLGIVLGLRACDVAALKLSDIDWISGEIRVLQAKTAISVVLPLTKDVGEALKDYILNARPASDSAEVFLRLRAPYIGLKSAVTIGEIYAACSKAAGLEVNKKFHTLRRSLGTSMLASGASVDAVAQVLGHAEVDSTKKYIAVDETHLKMCALPFDGIKPKGGARK